MGEFVSSDMRFGSTLAVFITAARADICSSTECLEKDGTDLDGNPCDFGEHIPEGDNWSYRGHFLMNFANKSDGEQELELPKHWRGTCVTDAVTGESVLYEPEPGNGE